jgi:hypothetical protein
MKEKMDASLVVTLCERFVTRKETKDGISTITVKYLETEAAETVLSLAFQFPG